jgi:hypothetical protein
VFVDVAGPGDWSRLVWALCAAAPGNAEYKEKALSTEQSGLQAGVVANRRRRIGVQTAHVKGLRYDRACKLDKREFSRRS